MTKTHGQSKTRLYAIWSKIKVRCYNEWDRDYKWYGAKGIKLCEEWDKSYLCFMKWAIENGYKENLTIDRINPFGDYEPSNCRWTTRKEQARNKTTNRIIEYNGEKRLFIDWCREFNILPVTLRQRFKRGWSVEKAFTTPIANTGKKKNKETTDD